MGLNIIGTRSCKGLNFAVILIWISWSLIGMCLVFAQDPCTVARRLPAAPYSRDSITRPNVEELFLCDAEAFTADEWIRFDSNETQSLEYFIPEACVNPPRCGTKNPIWMSGTHPTRFNPGPVNVFSCMRNSSQNCCGWKQPMQVKWCSPGYYVYKAHPPPGCYAAYCFNEPPKTYPDISTVRLEWLSDSYPQVRCVLEGVNQTQGAMYEARIEVNFDSTDYVTMNQSVDKSILDAIFTPTLTTSSRQICCYVRSYWDFYPSKASGDVQSSTCLDPTTSTQTTTSSQTASTQTTTTTTTITTTRTTTTIATATTIASTVTTTTTWSTTTTEKVSTTSFTLSSFTSFSHSSSTIFTTATTTTVATVTPIAETTTTPLIPSSSTILSSTASPVSTVSASTSYSSISFTSSTIALSTSSNEVPRNYTESPPVSPIRKYIPAIVVPMVVILLSLILLVVCICCIRRRLRDRGGVKPVQSSKNLKREQQIERESSSWLSRLSKSFGVYLDTSGGIQTTESTSSGGRPSVSPPSSIVTTSSDGYTKIFPTKSSKSSKHIYESLHHEQNLQIPH